jgi:hypothetical protein
MMGYQDSLIARIAGKNLNGEKWMKVSALSLARPHTGIEWLWLSHFSVYVSLHFRRIK